MDEITVWKASKIREDDPEPYDVLLRIEGDVGEQMPGGCSMTSVDDFYRTEAAKINEALSQLPQGTRHRLLVLLLEDHLIFYQGA